MKLNTKGRYAVMAMIDLAIHSKGSFVSLVSISKRNDITIAYLEQIFLKLRVNSLVVSSKGVKGGYILARDPKDISILDIIQAVDEKIDIVTCNAGKSCVVNSGKLCNSHDLWYNLTMNIFKYLKSISLEDAILNKLSVNKEFNFVSAAENQMV